jgi:hypothetical protein
VLRQRDANAEFNVDTTRRLEAQCRALGIGYSYKDVYIDEKNRQAIQLGQKPQTLGSTEMGRITAASNGFVHGTTLQIPTTGYHTMEESASIEACEAFIRLLLKLASVI